MSAPISLHDRLSRRIAWIALLGGVILLLFVGLDFDILLGDGYLELGTTGIVHEMLDHVVLPVLVLLYPTYLGTRWGLRTALDPLKTAAERVDAARAEERGFRVDTQGLPVEAAPFVDAVNNLLARLDEAASRQEAFAADVAHELRTPLAIARLETEQMDSTQASRLNHQLTEMSRLVEQLYLMAQLDSHADAPHHVEMVRLDEVAVNVARLMAPIADARGRAIELEIVESLAVTGRSEMLASALRNLVDNAIRMTPHGGIITIIAGPGARLRVRDQGPGLNGAQLLALCQRFKRLDHASAGGAGLGLTLVSRIMEIHGGRLRTCFHRRELRLVFPRGGRRKR